MVGEIVTSLPCRTQLVNDERQPVFPSMQVVLLRTIVGIVPSGEIQQGTAPCHRIDLVVREQVEQVLRPTTENNKLLHCVNKTQLLLT